MIEDRFWAADEDDLTTDPLPADYFDGWTQMGFVDG